LNDTLIALTHSLPGRVRLSVPGLKKNAVLSQKLEALLSNMKGVSTCRVSPVSGRILILFHEDEVCHRDIIDDLQRILDWNGLSVEKPAPVTEVLACRELEVLAVASRQKIEWTQLSQEQVLEILGVALERGLSEEESLLRLSHFGPNKLKEVKKRGFFVRFLDQFRDFLVQALLGSTTVCLIVGEVVDAAAILSILLVNAIIGASQEQRAAGAVEALKELTAPNARILREGRPYRVPAAQLVPGDVLLLEQGDIVPADARLLEVAGMEAEESALTGESLPVVKQPGAIASCVQLFDCDNMVFQGTTVAKGRALAVVTATGMETEIGKIAGLLQEGNEERRTPLQLKLAQTGKTVLKSSLLLSGAVVALGILRGGPVFNMFLTGVSLAVAAIPEGLPAIVTIALATGADRMARSNAVVKSLPAVESVGATTLICSDKTGTLTTNRQTVRMVCAGGQWWAFTGSGHDPDDGEVIGLVQEGGQDSSRLAFALTAALLCSNASLERKREKDGVPAESSRWVSQGDPTEIAILVAAVRAGLNVEEIRETHTRLHEVPFDAERRRMSVICSTRSGSALFVKGAPDVILERCGTLWRPDGETAFTESEKLAVVRANDRLAAKAMRVLAVAYRRLTGSLPGPAGDADQDLVFIGLIGIMDPPRVEVKDSIGLCRRAGIEVAMITGDHPNTAVAIGRELGILSPGEAVVLTGPEIENMNEEELTAALVETRIFARVLPRHKLRLVRAFQERGELVTMIGDGVNDAPAVKEADIGIAMGGAGTDVTKKSALMIITDDNFSTIVKAVEQGRGIYANIRKSVRYLLATNAGEVLLMFSAVALGLPQPLLPIQLLWLNLLGDGLPALALAVDPASQDLMNKKPQPVNSEIVDQDLRRKILSRGISIGATTLGAYIWGLRGGSLPRAQTLALATLTSGQLLHALDCRSEGGKRNVRNPFLLESVALSGALLAGAIYWPAARSIFRTVPLVLADWGIALGAAAFSSVLDRLFMMRNRC